ncbi:MAG TPA: TetR/AcrR family transcriptional regulator [Syntrophomonadaceae bacterium]|nr:TetR/AcrR family transcriptional regulator [Syntrophomonadaceae bacterium]
MQENYHHDDLKSELIEKGLKLLDEEGYEGFSLRKVAKACNVSHAAPYRHFKNKDELILAIGMEAMAKFSQSLQNAVNQYPDDPRSQLKEMGYSYIKFFTENPEYLRLIFLSDINKRINNSSQDSNGGHCFADKEISEHPFEILYRAVERYKTVIQSNTDNSMDQDALVLYCWGLVHGISILISRKEFPYQGDHLELARKILWEKAFA